MTRKDFILIAATLRAQRPAPTADAEWRVLCIAFADMLERNALAFNRERFLAACNS